jgi:monoamine oxidase
MNISHEVIIVGGGAAGMAAAVELARHGTDVAIVEARDRLGGRILTLHDQPFPVELGAEFMHGLAPELQHVVENGALRTCRTSGNHWFFDGAEVLKEGEFFGDIETVFSAMKKFALNEDASYSQFAEDYLRQHPDRKSAIEATRRYVEGFNAAKSNDVSLRWLLEQEDSSEEIDGERQARFVDGYDGVVEYYFALLKRFDVPIYFSSAVQCIEWQLSPIKLNVDGGEGSRVIEARRVLITLPIGVLQQKVVEFVPSLAQKQEALDALVSGQVRRSVLVFSHPFWHHMSKKRNNKELEFVDLGFIHSPELPIPTWWTQNPIDVPMLVGWAGGPPADPLANKTKDELIETSLRSLARIFGLPPSELRSNLEAFYSHDWQNDQYARCAYSYVKAGGLPASKTLAAPIGDVLFFAGEATDADGFSGTVHGAIRSGLRAAHEIRHCGRFRKTA